ncbi:hypothetical protein BDW69DRAFT_175779 [Aspergillus filifer]
MRTPDTCLPPALSTETITTLILSLDLTTTVSIEPLRVTAAFHAIYLINFPPSTGIPARPNPDGTITLVLRVSGRQLPGIKTRNEVGVMTWVRQNTTIPVPAVIRFDATEDNVIGHEFTLLEKAPGVSVDYAYATLFEEAKTQTVHQLTGYIIELHAKPWMEGYVGGPTLNPTGSVAPGAPIDENFWQVPDLDKYWVQVRSKETLERLNPIPSQGFSRYVSYNVGRLERYMHAIEVHPFLEAYRVLVPQIRAFITNLYKEENIDELNRVAYVLAHRDLHFANIMCDADQPGCPITAVLDWEFSGVGSSTTMESLTGFLAEYKMDA